MQGALRASSLVPPGFSVMGTENAGGKTIIVVRSTARASPCPSCGADSRQIHSHYQRQIADLPVAGRAVQLVAYVRRFRCRGVRCGQGIFAERFAAGILAPWARRTGRLEELVHHLGLALGGRPAASFARRLMLPISNDTLLRVVRLRGTPATPPPNIIGIDDWAWRRNHRYGTIICDLERRCPIKLLPDREPATAEAFRDRDCTKCASEPKGPLILVVWARALGGSRAARSGCWYWRRC
jgi:transposase